VVDATLEDRKVKRCDADMTVSQTGERHVCDRRVERFAEFHTAIGVSDSFSLSDLYRSGGEADLDQRVQTYARHRKVQRERSECAELGADAIVPEGDASELFYLARDTSSMPGHQSKVKALEKALPAHKARRVGRRAREDACIEAGLTKRMAVNNPITLPGPNHANGWTDPNGDIPTER
jgi:hypothetical protein